jgi:heptosyltransferase-2
MHFVILRFSSLGDLVMQTGFTSWLKFSFPKCKITFITLTQFTSLIENHPHIDKVIGYEKQSGLKDLKSLSKLGKQILSEDKVDFIIDLHGTTRAFFFKLLNFSIPSINLDKRRIERQILTKFKIDLLKNAPSQHTRAIIDYSGLFGEKFNLEDLKNSLNKDCEFVKSLSVTSSPQAFISNESNKPFDKYLVITPVASFAPKRWPIEKFNKLIEMILNSPKFNEINICIVAGPSDDYCDDLNTLVAEYPNRVINLKGQTNLAQSSQIIRESVLVVGNDSGMGHIAESFGVPVVSIFGPTSESFGFSPHLPESKTISIDLWCRPCSTTGKKKCFRKRQYCMEDVTINSVFNNITSTLNL